MSTASREWVDTQAHPFVAKHMFACAVWRKWWDEQERRKAKAGASPKEA